MFIKANKENTWGWIAACCGSLLAGGHWLTGLCYSRGYDFFLWIYNAWLLGEGGGSWVNWSSFSAAGQPAFKMAGVTDALALGIFVNSLGLEAGPRVYACILYLVAGTGMYVLGRMVSKSVLGGVVAANAYVFSWFISFTAYYQSYLSNFLLFALLPWGALWCTRAMVEESRGALLAAVAVVFIGLTSNAQVAIKMGLFMLPFSYLYAVSIEGVPWKRWLGYSMLWGGSALCLSAFLIVPAIALRTEVLLLGELRGNAFIPPWMMLFSIPLFGINYLLYQLAGISWLGRDMLVWAIYSDYVGISVLAITCCAWPLLKREGAAVVRGLFYLLALYAVLYFLLVPNIRASAWIGRTHNWAILTTVTFSLLCACGAAYLARRWPALAQWKLALVLCGAIALDLGGVSFFLNRLAITHTPLAELPEVQAWKELAEKDEGWPERGRFFTYNPDHTFYLLPVFERKAVANVIELRGRNWEYNSYVEHQLQSMRNADPTYKPAESLALLDVDYIDLARKLYEGQDKSNAFAKGMALLHGQGGVTQVLKRSVAADDRSYDLNKSDLDIASIVNVDVGEGGLGQVIFRNGRHFWSFVPEKTVLLLGETRVGEAFFERLTHIEDFRADRLLVVLVDDSTRLDSDELANFDVCIPVGSIIPPAQLPVWDMDDIIEFYATVGIERKMRLEKGEQSAERLELMVSGSLEDQMVFLSQQRFNDWHAYDQEGMRLSVFKAAAGLTAILIPAETTRVEYRYELPLNELLARYFSLLTAVALLVWWRLGRGGRGVATHNH
jgi:hypothetical protein